MFHHWRGVYLRSCIVQTSLARRTPTLLNSLRTGTAAPIFPAGDGITAVAAIGFPFIANRGTPATLVTDISTEYATRTEQTTNPIDNILFLIINKLFDA